MAEPPFELAVERLIAASPERVWQVWTERLEEWFCPLPWKAQIVENDMRPGGRSALEMRGPNGESHPTEGVYLDVRPCTLIVLTDAYGAGWMPKKPFMTGIFSLQPAPGGTLYRAAARHWDEETMKQHQEMGFDAGWAAATAQLAELAEAD